MRNLILTSLYYFPELGYLPLPLTGQNYSFINTLNMHPTQLEDLHPLWYTEGCDELVLKFSLYRC